MVNYRIYHGLAGMVLLALVACAQAPAASAVLASQADQARVSPITPDVSISTVIPTASTAAGPAVETATAVPPASIDVTSPLAEFAAAWSSADVERIRAFYADNAAYVSTDEVVALQRGEQPPVLVSADSFAGRVGEHAGQRLRVLGPPIVVYDKLAGFLFRWEGEIDGYNGAALLRYEGDQIVLHTYAVSSESTPNPNADNDVLQSADVTPLMAVWASGDIDAVKAQYLTQDGAFNVFNDEDILLSLRGDVHSPAELAGDYLASEVINQARPWGMQATGNALRLGEFVLTGWSWEMFEEPIGYGVRFLRTDGDQISEDIRYAIRPWETQGQTFLSGYGAE